MIAVDINGLQLKTIEAVPGLSTGQQCIGYPPTRRAPTPNVHVPEQLDDNGHVLLLVHVRGF
jgi:hypothetical protein